MSAAPLAAPLRDRAYALIQRALGRRPMLDRLVADHPTVPMIQALIDLEERFGVDIDVDEAFLNGRTVDQLLDLVEARARRAAPMASNVITLADFRRLGPIAETPSTLRDLT